MASLNSDLFITSARYGNLEHKDPRSWERLDCPFCGGTQMLVIGFNDVVPGSESYVEWLRCANCLRGVVRNGDAVSPATLPLDTPRALEGDTLTAWNEVRACLSVGASTAAVMMCRKLLFHVAVEHGLPDKDSKGRGPTFAEALDHIEESDVFTARMRPWVERIKDVGNEANHDLAAISLAQARDVATFTRQLINLAYELDAMIAGPNTSDAHGDGSGD
ncbi:DUF4145 domain-containing protein [[Mycobacterium] crassicus]|uniref:DUF4145 domain-containing protein n=1 Tax=[Mycobacterium] crassicus TaxID=2872309 RepID=A0ABU5XP58_9MYCO|nr:DUF4145 domain-containing protein [Mycolicibacter sp. MYC098]MEB3024060.1 DUF4145 domain-containing protein [Mycolicibacter sp. MYC098]